MKRNDIIRAVLLGVNGAILLALENWAAVLWSFACFIVLVMNEEYERRMLATLRMQSATIEGQQLLIKAMHSRLVNLENKDEIQPTV